MENPFGQFESAAPGMSPPNLLLILSLLAFVGADWRDSLDAVKAPLNSSQKPQCVINIILATNPSTIRAATGKVSSIPARPSIDSLIV